MLFILGCLHWGCFVPWAGLWVWLWILGVGLGCMVGVCFGLFGASWFSLGSWVCFNDGVWVVGVCLFGWCWAVLSFDVWWLGVLSGGFVCWVCWFDYLLLFYVRMWVCLLFLLGLVLNLAFTLS